MDEYHNANTDNPKEMAHIDDSLLSFSFVLLYPQMPWEPRNKKKFFKD